MFKITYDQYLAMLLDPDTPTEMIKSFSTFDPGQGGAFDPVMIPNPRWVELTQDQIEAESAMHIGNGFARWRRQAAFKRAIATGDQRPVIVAEGDSWFQFPIFIDETIDHLSTSYLVSCVSAAGDTARNMIFGDVGSGRQEYLKELHRNADKVKAFLLSAAGNDIIGEDEETGDGTPVLKKLLRNPGNGSKEATDYVNEGELQKRIDFLHHAYRTVCTNVRKDERFVKLPILIHGYDVVYPYPWNDGDLRNPLWAAKDKWLGSAFKFAGIEGPIRRQILEMLINRLYGMLQSVADEQQDVYVVDCRGALPDLSDWADEIHATSQGYAKVAQRFSNTLRELGIG